MPAADALDRDVVDGPDADGATERAPRWRRWIILVVLVVIALVVLAIAAWVLLYPDTEQDALDAVLDDPDLVVTHSDDLVALSPATGDSDTTVVFYPGAGVPPDAYLPTWAPVVEDVGVTVVVTSMPLRLAVLDIDAAGDVRGSAEALGLDPGGQWWVGGHSLGGAMAASFLAGVDDGGWDGLVLWASYPAGDGLAMRQDLAAVSVSGSSDGLTTPDEVDASRAELPTETVFVAIDGVTHAQFGAYGEQRGDGEATVDDDTARQLIASATAAGISDGR